MGAEMRNGRGVWEVRGRGRTGGIADRRQGLDEATLPFIAKACDGLARLWNAGLDAYLPALEHLGQMEKAFEIVLSTSCPASLIFFLIKMISTHLWSRKTQSVKQLFNSGDTEYLWIQISSRNDWNGDLCLFFMGTLSWILLYCRCG